ncbi:MAG: DUF4855 domain-containing protein [Planctomycetia bacterium]|nr:DUF4855 domain-containing protein [Planctomycetia bacterium]
MKNLSLLVGLLGWLVPSVYADYLTESRAGFRNIALCYENPDADAAYFRPMLVKYTDDQPTTQAGFDAFLFLRYTIHGKKTEVATFCKEDFQWFLTSCFENAADVPELNRAVRELRNEGFLKREAPIRVMFAIPWLSPKATDFGDVDGDGVSENLSTADGRRRVLNWFTEEILSRMRAFPELELWGFYMMREGLSEADGDIARQYCDVIHAKGYRALWIPYFQAQGVEQGYDLGMDAVIQQSNWTFRVDGDSGARRNRIVLAAEFAKEQGLGIELEINPSSTPQWRRIFLQTLESGTRTGFQHAPSAAYFGNRFFWPTSPDPQDRRLYAIWMDYLAGKPISLDPPGTWTQTQRDDGTLEILYTCQKPEAVRIVDIFLTETETAFFSGLTQIDTRVQASDPWTPTAWKLRRDWNPRNRTHQNLSVALPGQAVRQLRIRMTPDAGSAPPNVTDVDLDATIPPLLLSEAYRKTYTTNQPSPTVTYPDTTGRKLLDGVTGREWSKHVGWQGSLPVTISLDFHQKITFDEIRIHAHPGPSAGIRLPDSVTAIFSEAAETPRLSGMGKAPQNLEAVADFHFQKEGDFLQWKRNAPAHARSMTLSLSHSGWLFLSELEFFRNGKRLDSSAFCYRLSRAETFTQTKENPYPDDGQKLTDGQVGTDFSKQCFGSHTEKMRVTLDLGTPLPVGSVTAWVLDGGAAGVRLPDHASVRFSTDGEQWTSPQEIPLPPRKKCRNLQVVPLTHNAHKTQARYVEVELTPQGWTMLSEITVKR